MFDNGNFRRKRKRKSDSAVSEKKPPSSSSPSSSSSASDCSSSEPSKIPRIPHSRNGGDCAALPSLGSFQCDLEDSLLPPTPPHASSPSLFTQHTPPPPAPPPQAYSSPFSPGGVVPQWDACSASSPLYSSVHPSVATPPYFPSTQSTSQAFSSLLDSQAASPPLYVDLQTCLQSELQQLHTQLEPLFSGGFSDSLPLDSLVLQQ